MNGFRIGGAMALGLTLGTPAAGADCPIASARYVEPTSGYQLSFAPIPGGPTSAQSNRFTLSHPDATTRLEGEVAWNMGLSRPQGQLALDCPGKAKAGEAAAGCILWQGLVYGLVDGKIDLLPEEGHEAPDQVLLPDLGRTLRTALWDHETDWTEIPFDVFDYVECAP
jgi:hypothetical protein